MLRMGKTSLAGADRRMGDHIALPALPSLPNREAPFALEPQAYRIAYAVEGGPTCTLEVSPGETYVTQDISVLARMADDVLSFEVTPLVPLRVESLGVRLAHAFARDERVLLNGYQSWTTTEWLPAHARMTGLGSVPRPIVDLWAIDGIGDYRFTDYENQPGCQHGFTYGVFRRGDAYLLVGSLDETRGLTLVRTNAQAGFVSLTPECPQGVLPAGQPVVLGEFALVSGSESQVYDRWFQLAGITARPVCPLTGYSSWYRHYGDIDESRLLSDLRGAREELEGMGLLRPAASGQAAGSDGGCEAGPSGGRGGGGTSRHVVPLFQIDDGFCKVGDWLHVDGISFPRGLGALAGDIREAGFLPGLWLAPFVCERESRVFQEHADWLLRDGDGNLVRTGPHWSGAYALDSRNPQVRDYVHQVVGTAVHEWGFGLLKLDFLYAACMHPHDGLNRGQLMADALDLLRQAAGQDALLLGCGVPLGPAFGKLDYCRIGCDVGLDWDDKPHMRLLHRERVSTKHSLGNTLSRAPLDGRAFGNDPDVFFLRDDVKLSSKRRRRLLEADTRLGSVLLTSDDMGRWGTAERELYQAAVAKLVE